VVDQRFAYGTDDKEQFRIYMRMMKISRASGCWLTVCVKTGDHGCPVNRKIHFLKALWMNNLRMKNDVTLLKFLNASGMVSPDEFRTPHSLSDSRSRGSEDTFPLSLNYRRQK
jgi:hypothetical protein